MEFEKQIGTEQFNKGHELANKANEEFDKVVANTSEDADQIHQEMDSYNDAETITPAQIGNNQATENERVRAKHDAMVRHQNFVNEAAQYLGRSVTDGSVEADKVQQKV